MNPASTPSATITTSTVSPRRSRFGIEFSPVPIDVAAVTNFFAASDSRRGISSRQAAGNAPDVMIRSSSVVLIGPHSFISRPVTARITRWIVRVVSKKRRGAAPGMSLTQSFGAPLFWCGNHPSGEDNRQRAPPEVDCTGEFSP